MKRRIARIGAATILALAVSGCAMVETFFGDPPVYKSPYYLYQEYVGGSFVESYQVDDLTGYARKDPVTETDLETYQQGTGERWAETARRIKDTNEWIQDDWIVYIGRNQEWETMRNELGQVESRRVIFVIVVDNRE